MSRAPADTRSHGVASAVTVLLFLLLVGGTVTASAPAAALAQDMVQELRDASRHAAPQVVKRPAPQIRRHLAVPGVRRLPVRRIRRIQAAELPAPRAPDLA